jgi:hypothetical protein
MEAMKADLEKMKSSLAEMKTNVAGDQRREGESALANKREYVGDDGRKYMMNSASVIRQLRNVTDTAPESQ